MFYFIFFTSIVSKTVQREGHMGDFISPKVGELFSLRTRCVLQNNVTLYEIKRLHTHHGLQPEQQKTYHDCF